MDPRRAFLALLLSVSIFSLSACRGDTPDNPADGDSESISYRGEKIHCTEPGSGNSSVLSCDFTKFYIQHPDLLADLNEDAEDEVQWYKEQGHVLPCIAQGSGEAKRISCDWARFYALHPELTGLPR